MSDAYQVKVAEGQLEMYGPEASVSTYLGGGIRDEKSFDAYPWIDPDDV